MLYERTFIRFLLIFLPCIEGATRLNEYISHYEPLSYNQEEVHQKHQRAKRSIRADTEIDINFHSHGEHFHLRLKRDTSAFNKNLVVVGSRGNINNYDLSSIYTGYRVGHPNSHVFGSVREGVFDGKIISPLGTYYVERAKHYFPNHTDQNFHSVIYAENSVTDPFAKLRKGGGCGVTDEVEQWMERVQNSVVEEDPPTSPTTATPSVLSPAREFHFPHLKYTKEANFLTSNQYTAEEVRRKRSTHDSDRNKKTCSLFIRTDPLLWKHIWKHEGEDDKKTTEEILSLIAQHVKAVNHIYSNTPFIGRDTHRGIRFEVQRIKIDNYTACQPGYIGEENKFCIPNIDVSNFLNVHSQTNHEDFCLAYVFTYRDFTGGTLGLAWVASASGASGGICEKYKTYTENIEGLHHTTKRSLNTGIITFVNYNSRVPPKVSQLTLAHEIGHNFGSPHDFPPDCRPGGAEGNYIMFASATSGDRPNNNQFSPCSKKNVSSVLDAIYTNKKRNCFQASNGAFCGNKIVEEGEECDCGFNKEECEEECCYPRVISGIDTTLNSSARGCRRRANTECSPSEGPCCTKECLFRTDAKICRENASCTYDSHCNGKSALCPEPAHKENITTVCNEQTQVCLGGECRGSVCLKFNLQECFLTSKDHNIKDKRRLCELACQKGNDSSTCQSTSEWALTGQYPGLNGNISLRPGAPCDNFQGYCDVFLKCRAVDAEGPLARLKNLLFDKQTLLTIAQWITEFWWAVLLMGIGFIIIMGCFIKCCAVHTPSSNPKKPPARRVSETLATLSRPMNTLRRKRYNQQHPHQYQQDPRHPHQQHQGAPPPYPGRPTGGPSRAPAHGYGEGRGHYNRPKGTTASAPSPGLPGPGPPSSGPNRSGWHDPYAGAYHGRNAFEMRQHKV